MTAGRAPSVSRSPAIVRPTHDSSTSSGSTRLNWSPGGTPVAARVASGGSERASGVVPEEAVAGGLATAGPRTATSARTLSPAAAHLRTRLRVAALPNGLTGRWNRLPRRRLAASSPPQRTQRSAPGIRPPRSRGTPGGRRHHYQASAGRPASGRTSQRMPGVWVPEALSPYATCAYSWIEPLSRSRRRTYMPVPSAGGCARPAGEFCGSVRCGRWGGSGRRIRRGPAAGAVRRCSASGPGTRGGRCPPSVRRSHSRAAPGPGL